MKPRWLTSIWAVALVLFLSACGSAAQTVQPATPTTVKSTTGASCSKPLVKTASAPIEQARAKGYKTKTLATATVNALPTGTLYASFIEVPQPGGTTITHEHAAGFVYVIDGTHELTIKGGPTVTLTPGKASFIGAHVVHSHINPGNSVNHWYFVSLRPNTARNAPPLFPNQKVLYATPDLPPLPSGSYCESLILSTHQPDGGRTPAHIHSGLEVNIVLDGTIKFILAGQTMTLTAGQGMYHLPNTPIQGVNEGTGIAHHLTLLVWPQGQPIRTDLNHTP
jgi:quercetin dioxygenase-like cupin family protein